MQPILQSGFLKALAYALLSSIWQLGLLWFAVIIFLRVFKLSSSQKFRIAFTAQAIGFLFFIYSLFNNYNHQSALNFLKTANTNYILNTVSYIQVAMPFTAIIYLIFFIWHILKLFSSYWFTQNLRKKHIVKMPAENRIFLMELIKCFSLHKKVTIYLSKIIKCPLTIGFLKPVILIPLAAVNHLTKEQMEAVILHEMAHIKRADYLLNLIQCVIQTILFFNVFSRMLNNIIERERENACDDSVIQFKYNSFHYAEALLKLGKLQTFASLAMAASGKKENVLLYRVKRLIKHQDNNYHYKYSPLRLGLFTVIFVFALLCSFFTKTSGLSTNLNVDYSPVILTKEINNKNSKKDITAIQEKLSKKANIEYSKNENKIHQNKTTGKTTTLASEKTFEIKQPLSDVTQTMNPDFLINAKALFDSAKQIDYSKALNQQLLLNKDVYRKALSYQSFKQLENMLELTGDSVTVTEDPGSKDNYKKLITIETTDKNGDKNVYQVIVELYQ